MSKENLKIVMISMLAASILLSCEDREVLISKGGFPLVPVNLTMFNSEYDDYNSDLAPGEYDMSAFAFSSNRDSKGQNFDISLHSFGLDYPFEKDEVTIYEAAGYSEILMGLIHMRDIFNTPSNEFGPYIHNCLINEEILRSEFVFFFAQEDSRKLDLKYMIYERNKNLDRGIGYQYSGPFEVTVINTREHNEAYISVADSFLYFCSDEDQDYDIRSISIPVGITFLDFLKEPSIRSSNPLEMINSEADDKCPFGAPRGVR